MASKQRGFTLIEVLVALLLMALVSLISWRALDTVERTNERLERISDDVLGLMRVLGQIERDIQHHADDSILPVFQDATQASTRHALPAGIHYEQVAGEIPSLQITRAAAADNGTWQQVRWWLEDQRLMRAVGPASAKLPLPAAPIPGTPVLDGVIAFEVRAWLPGRGWNSLPLPTGTPSAEGLEIMIERAPGPDGGRFRKVVLLP